MAEAIYGALCKPLVFENVFEEIKGASKLRRIYAEDPEAKRISNLRNEHIDDPDWHHSDEENFFDTRSRAETALAKLANRTEERIAVVTHMDFLRMLMYSMLLSSFNSPKMYVQTRWSFDMDNAGVSVCQFSEQRGW